MQSIAKSLSEKPTERVITSNNLYQPLVSSVCISLKKMNFSPLKSFFPPKVEF